MQSVLQGLGRIMRKRRQPRASCIHTKQETYTHTPTYTQACPVHVPTYTYTLLTHPTYSEIRHTPESQA